jgi:histone H3/H4
VEKRAPTTPGPDDAPASAPPRQPERRLVRPAAAQPPPEKVPREVLIVASRLKEYVRARVGYNTSDRVLEPLSEIVRRVCDEAIRNAAREGRKTVLDRDVPKS